MNIFEAHQLMSSELTCSKEFKRYQVSAGSLAKATEVVCILEFKMAENLPAKRKKAMTTAWNHNDTQKMETPKGCQQQSYKTAWTAARMLLNRLRLTNMYCTLSQYKTWPEKTNADMVATLSCKKRNFWRYNLKGKYIIITSGYNQRKRTRHYKNKYKLLAPPHKFPVRWRVDENWFGISWATAALQRAVTT